LNWTSETSKGVSKMLASARNLPGARKFMPLGVQVSPEKIDRVLGGVSGGLFLDVLRGVESLGRISGLIDPTPLQVQTRGGQTNEDWWKHPYNYPVLGRFFSNVPSNPDFIRTRNLDLDRKADRLKNAANSAMQDGRMKEAEYYNDLWLATMKAKSAPISETPNIRDWMPLLGRWRPGDEQLLREAEETK
ncbi:unnamed protein product, partial [marine sediment metagenome]